ncbi:MAG: DUF1284 domain-containing protein [Culicoidibacterales bacterium]
MMITLRPHHLLCTEAFRGFGYSDAFVQNFQTVLFNLQQPDTIVILKLASDPICAACPSLDSQRRCITDQKVLAIDLAVLQAFHLSCDTPYHYQQLIQQLKQKMNITTFTACCHTCEWYQSGICMNIWCSKT